MKIVFLAASGSIVKYAYTDVINDPKIEYCDYPYDFKTGLKKLIFSRRVANLTPFFLKKSLYKKYLGYEFLKNVNPKEEVLFLFTCQYNMFFDTFFPSFLHFLKKLYPKSKYAFYYNDIISTCYPECIDMIKSEFDLVLTFDQIDAKTYGLTYYGEVYSKNDTSNVEAAEESDVFFVGSDRKRFDILLKLFKKLADEDKKTIFYLFDILPENKERFSEYLPDATESEDRVTYKNSVIYKNVYCPYPKTLSHIKSCRAMLEITLSAQHAATLRLLESVVYGKKLITNCRAAIEKPYYHKENIFFIDSIDSTDGEALAEFLDAPGVPVTYDFSPLHLVEYCKENLYKRSEN